MFHPDRLSQPAKVKKPSKIFVCSMADLFGDWVPREWIESVLSQALKNPWHTFQFLTKNPKRLQEFNPWPENCWVGCTITNQEDMNERVGYLLNADARVRFISHEPLLSEIRQSQAWWHKTSLLLQWAIIGAMTGPGAVKPKPEWVQCLVDQYRAAGVPVFLKDNLKWPEKIQEWPNNGGVTAL
jgi:protein gp37